MMSKHMQETKEMREHTYQWWQQGPHQTHWEGGNNCQKAPDKQATFSSGTKIERIG